ncbi:hypothetical protein [Neisseria weaveri]|uniref:hypothetical protein n=1 Tax=Neisseria weaveri TaxID=28091 RepID=UPI0002231DAC|nr:hypothetical protein [Neisseria weaveri]EGV34721.1 hypothetical protein l13_19800 [Neisseria weaveri ATCC 51223]SAY50650.1 Uncharacterised protein [Neisseria weaveri]
MFKLKNIIQTTDIEFTDKHLGGLVFRLEISQESKQSFAVELYKREIYSLNPTDGSGDIADEIIWVNASHLLPDNQPCLSAEAAVDKGLNALSRYFEIEQ